MIGIDRLNTNNYLEWNDGGRGSSNIKLVTCIIGAGTPIKKGIGADK